MIAATTTRAAQFEATREDLGRIAGTLSASPVPTLAGFAGQVLDLLGGRTLDTYRHHILRLVDEFGHRRLDEVQPLELERLAVQTRRDATAPGDNRVTKWPPENQKRPSSGSGKGPLTWDCVGGGGRI